MSNPTFPMIFSKLSPKSDSSSCRKDLSSPIGKVNAKKFKGKEQEIFKSNMKHENRLTIKPLTKESVFFYYIPALGCASYTVLSINVLNPSLRFGFFPKRDLTNVLLATTLFGTGCYLYSRPHIKASKKNSRYGFSALGSIMFNFSSVLLWAILRSVLPENVAVCSAAGLASSYVIVKGATNYLEYVDSKISL